MRDRIHDVEVDTSETVARSLLLEQCPQWGERVLTSVQSSGTSNALWRMHGRAGDDRGDDVVLRLPRTDGAAASMRAELTLLPALARRSELAIGTPQLLHVGRPAADFGLPWAVLNWLPGHDAWSARNDGVDTVELAQDLAGVIHRIHAITDIDVPEREVGGRGGAVELVLERVERWLVAPEWSADSLLDVAAVRRVVAETREAADADAPTSFVHGDLIPGNLLVAGRRVTAVIDWGSAAYADPAQDLAPAWSMFSGRARDAFREAMDTDDASWLRARAFELEHAVGGVLYYAPRRHLLGDVMVRTLRRVLADS